ncbi:sulfite exporter TauE/SafE family protein [Mailhella sp.]|uniref:sulfite exporter TauE/SafE family protein n=1 Tax=Mailhella sp. TaxID=1981029 RepID=UPI003AB77604
MFVLLILCVAGGSLIGLLNGMLGMGGTFIVIPLLDEVLVRMGLPLSISHVMAIGTAPSTVLFTCVASYFAHKAHGSVRSDLLRRMGGGIFVGSLAGAFLAPHAPTLLLKLLFAGVVMIMGLYLLFPFRPRERERERLGCLEAAGVFFGMLASMSGLAGTLLCLTYLNWRGVVWRQAVGTSAGIGLIIAVTSTAGYVFSGWGSPELPTWSLGYVYLPGTLCLIVPSMLMARVGAFLVNWKKMPLSPMKRCVGLLNVLVAIRVVVGLW